MTGSTLSIAAKITRELFELGDKPGSKVHRIEFRGGYWSPDRKTEVPQGGLNEDAMTKWLASALERHGVSNDEFRGGCKPSSGTSCSQLDLERNVE